MGPIRRLRNGNGGGDSSKLPAEVCSSYYNSPRFKADLLRAAEQKRGSEFVPISRFGIGLLSCFVAGDQVEINTRYLNTDGELSDGDA